MKIPLVRTTIKTFGSNEESGRVDRRIRESVLLLASCELLFSCLFLSSFLPLLFNFEGAYDVEPVVVEWVVTDNTEGE